MSIPIPPNPNSPDSIPVIKPKEDKTDLKDFDAETNWKQSPTNPDIQINVITGRLRTRDFYKPNGPTNP